MLQIYMYARTRNTLILNHFDTDTKLPKFYATVAIHENSMRFYTLPSIFPW